MKERGFTLVEMLVAVAIFAIISVVAYRLLDEALAAARQLELHSDQLARWQRAIWKLESDISQMTFRRTRNAFGDQEPWVRGESGNDDSSGFLEFTRAGWANPANLPRSDLEHIIYQLKDGTLWRLSWFYPDRARAEADLKRPMFSNVHRWTIKFLDVEGQWRMKWAPVVGDEPDQLPRAIALDFELDDGRHLKRVFPLGEAPNE